MSPPPLIAHVIHHLVTGGMENGLVNLINRIPSDRYRHCVICVEDFSEFRGRIERADVEVIALRKSALTQMALYQRLQATFRQLHPEIVHGRNLSGLDALLPAWSAGVPVRIHGEHGWDVTDLSGTRAKPRWLRRLHSPLVDRYVAVSKHLKSYLVCRVGIAPSRITQIYNGVDVARFAPAGSKPAGIMPSTFYGDDKVIVGTVGRLEAVKDHATLVHAFAALLRETPKFRATLRLAIVGDGPQCEALAAATHQEGIADVTWLPGARADVTPMYRCFDIFALPSLNEGVSNTLLEAMAVGLPTIATAAGGNVELVEHDATGRLIPVSDSEALAAEIKRYALDRELRTRHGSAGRLRVLSNFSLDSMVDAYLRVYDSVRTECG